MNAETSNKVINNEHRQYGWTWRMIQIDDQNRPEAMLFSIQDVITKKALSQVNDIPLFREAAELHIFRPGKIVEIQLSIVVVSMNLKGKQLEEDEVKVQKTLRERTNNAQQESEGGSGGEGTSKRKTWIDPSQQAIGV
ncbi:hypothetical protein ARMGADRAFT_1040069 [Armillaria gallica]|uniref:Uncharacterized protein n=1 Tax=Armillaria gallica TaxID=47427 RepID=A0A2H3CML0_ARMGA|nr:hypothetical protein ARMGADRAFT_1040069 [Armillaria gallica]